jgi:phosphoserine phosphatase
VALSEHGRAQAAALARRLAAERIDRLYSSDLTRAFETARIVGEPHGLEVTPDPRLREFAFGAWEGLTWDEILARHPELREAGRTSAGIFVPEGGESFAQVRARVKEFFDELAAFDDARVVIVTHAGPLHAALAALEAVPLDETGAPAGVRFSPAGVTRLAMEGGRARLITLNDVGHLDSAG